ncbi:MAG: hypothetical protein FWF97_03020 [Alphaproteobacteria bacterium]|nr:hypothetical protein [Alphaproteobacteria bacterium]
MNIIKIIKGGFVAGRRTYIVSGIGIISAVAAYLIGDENIFNVMNTIFTLGGIYFLRKSTERNQNANSRKIPKR